MMVMTMRRVRWACLVVRPHLQAAVIVGLVGAILLLAGCGEREPPPAQVVDTFCADSSPFPAEHAGGLDAVGRRWVHAHNCQGVRRCGWLPGLDPAVCAP
jgi:hypothetical protein